MRGILIILIVVLFLSSFDYVNGNTDWEVFGEDVAHSGWGTSYAPNYTLYSPLGLVTSSVIDPSDSIENGIIIKNNKLYINADSAFYVKDMAIGVITKFPHANPTQSLSAPVIANDKYCYVDGRNIICRNLIDDNIAWTFTVPNLNIGLGESSLVYANGKLWTGTRSFDRIQVPAYIYAFDDNGSLVHNITPPMAPAPFNEHAERTYTPAISEGKVILAINYGISDSSSRLIALNETNGSIEWNYLLDIGEGAMILNIPSVNSDKVFVSVIIGTGLSQLDYVLALNKNDGAFLWKGEVNAADQTLLKTMPTIYGGKVIVASSSPVESYIHAFYENNGSKAWTTGPLPGDIQAPVSVVDSMILVGTNFNSMIYGISTVDGSIVWSEPAVNPIVTTPSIVNDTVYFVDDAANLIEMKAKTSKSEILVLTTNGPTPFSVPEVHADFLIGSTAGVSGLVQVDGKIDEAYLSRGFAKLDKYFSFSADPILAASVAYIYVRQYYTDDDLVTIGINESDLEMYLFDGLNWSPLIDSGVNTVENYIFGNISTQELATILNIGGGEGGFALDESTAPVTFNFGGVGDLVDTDKDGLDDANDNCKLISNSGQEDEDNDGAGDACDVCLGLKNGDQLDTDKDGMGNACDDDDDGDGILDVVDNCQLVPYNFAADYDGDGVQDECDSCPLLNLVDDSGLVNLINLNNSMGQFSDTIFVENPASAQINLGPGFNLVSLPIKPYDNSIESVLATIDGNYSVVWTFGLTENGFEWRNYNPNKPAFLQGLTTLDENQGFWIKMNQAATLSVGGVEPATGKIPIRDGLNLIGFTSLTDASPNVVFADVSNQINIVYEFDPVAQNFEIYVPGGTNTLGNIDVGKAYWVDSNSNTAWVFENGVFSGVTGYPRLYIAEPTRAVLIELMEKDKGSQSSKGAIINWLDGGCDVRVETSGNNAGKPKPNQDKCAFADAKIQEFKDLLEAQRGNDVGETTADMYMTCFANL